MKKVVISLFSFLLFSVNAHAITSYVGDVDGFGFGNAAGLFNVSGGSPDINSNGVLDSGDALPDINNDGAVAWNTRDNFDNRIASESSATNGAQWTDVALSQNYSSAPGLADSASFTFNFTIDVNDPFHGSDHYINLVYGDYDVNPMTAVVEGTVVNLLGNTDANIDGAIWRAYSAVSWSDMLDGLVTIDIVAPNEPYVTFDYALLDAVPLQTSPVPEPSTLIMLGLGLSSLAWLKRRKTQPTKK